MRKCVLIADDHAIVRGMMQSLFEDHGFEVCNAENGSQALQKAQESHPDLIVLDMAMPVMNGLDTARALRKLMPLVPIIMFTSFVGAVVEREARTAGIAAVVSKSEPAHQLIAQANRLLH